MTWFFLTFVIVFLVYLLKNVQSIQSSVTQRTSSTYDFLIIGGGSAGLTAAKFAKTFGKSVAIIEKGRTGGDCTHSGCVPSKALLKSSEVAQTLRTAPEYGISVKNGGWKEKPKDSPLSVNVDLNRITERIDNIKEKIYEEDDSVEVLNEMGIEVIQGEARFRSNTDLSVRMTKQNNQDESQQKEIQQVSAKRGILIATGATAIRQPKFVTGLDTIRYMTYEEVFQDLLSPSVERKELPKRITLVGGGPIGCEMAQAFSRLGSEVSLIAESLLPNDEPLAGENLEKVFAKEGISRIKGRLRSVKPLPDKSKEKSYAHTATCLSKGTNTAVDVSGDLLILAIGRRPIIPPGFSELGGQLNKKNGGIEVDDALKTTLENVYAAGDCTGDRQFTHYAGYQGAIAARNILLPLSDSGMYKNVPSTTFTSPEVASVGLVEKEAVETYESKGMKVTSRTVPINKIDRAECNSDEFGFIKITYLEKSYEILGACIMSPCAGEMISEIAVAMKTKLKVDELATVMHPYPSYSFALQVLAADIYYEKLGKSKPIVDFLEKLKIL